MKGVMGLCAIALISFLAQAEEAGPEQQTKMLSGMSVLGNNEAPKSLVIVPWKSSQIGDGIGIVDSLRNRPMPIDREVFGRELEYYHIRTESRGSGDVVLNSPR